MINYIPFFGKDTKQADNQEHGRLDMLDTEADTGCENTSLIDKATDVKQSISVKFESVTENV